MLFTFINSTKTINEINGNYRIVQVISSGYIINNDSKKILLKTKSYFNIDDLVNVSSTNIESLLLKKQQYDYYLKSLGIKYIANNVTISKVNDKISTRSKIINYLQEGPEFYVNYISLVLLGKKNDQNKDLYEKIKYISILHLFTISGFHINLFMAIILWILKKFGMKIRYSTLVGLIIVILYLYILNFPISSIRSFLFLFSCFINKEFFKEKFSKINILALIMLLMFILNPFIIFSLSFIFTFLITFGILFVIDTKNKKIKTLLIILVSYLSSVIVSINVNGWLNIFGIVNSIVFSPIVVVNYIITIFGFPFKSLLNNYYNYVDYLVNLFYNNSIIIDINISNNFTNLYYLFLFLIISIIKHYNIICNRNINLVRGTCHLHRWHKRKW